MSESEFKKLKLKGDFSFQNLDPKKTNHATSTLKTLKKLDV
jgi:hypothetical protein